jgi:hypothetical protein
MLFSVWNIWIYGICSIAFNAAMIIIFCQSINTVNFEKGIELNLT